jgi:hypothetical protein
MCVFMYTYIYKCTDTFFSSAILWARSRFTARRSAADACFSSRVRALHVCMYIYIYIYNIGAALCCLQLLQLRCQSFSLAAKCREV